MGNSWYTIGFVIIVILCMMGGLVFMTKYLVESSNISEKIIIALIAALSTIFTITGSILTNRLLTNEQIRKEKEKEKEFLKIKREFYHEFSEPFLMSFAYKNSGLLWTKEAIENKNKFLINKMRLPLYASQDVIEFFEGINKGQSDFSELFTLIREDILDSDLKEFKNLEKVTVHLPAIQIDSSLQSQIDKVKSDYGQFKSSELFDDFIKIFSTESAINGIPQTQDNYVILNKLRMEKLLEYSHDLNVFTLSLRGKNYYDLYKLERLYSK
ncbi:MAG: hypothetical protein AAF944_14635 [Bacteroidota bacterium]